MPIFGGTDTVYAKDNYGQLRFDGIFRTYANVNAVVFKPWFDTQLRAAVAVVRSDNYIEKEFLESFGITCALENDNCNISIL